MRKLMLLAAMLAMVLVVAAPALAQDATAGDIDESVNDSFNTEVQYADCDVVQAAVANQYGGDATASGDAAAASVANELGISQEAVVACLDSTADTGDDTIVVPVAPVEDGIDNDGDGTVDEADDSEVVAVETNGNDDDADGTVDEAGEDVAVEVAESDDAADTSDTSDAAESADVTVLPDTGGASLFTLGAGALLVGGGLLARRIFS